MTNVDSECCIVSLEELALTQQYKLEVIKDPLELEAGCCSHLKADYPNRYRFVANWCC